MLTAQTYVDMYQAKNETAFVSQAIGLILTREAYSSSETNECDSDQEYQDDKRRRAWRRNEIEMMPEMDNDEFEYPKSFDVYTQTDCSFKCHAKDRSVYTYSPPRQTACDSDQKLRTTGSQTKKRWQVYVNATSCKYTSSTSDSE